jgi:Fe-S-cluster containining protein
VKRKFSCIPDCSDCCINREYYPSEQFGKIGVLLLPEEVKQIEAQAQKLGVSVTILPRIAVSSDNSPERIIIAYQLMGKNDDGDLCPFLDTESGRRSPHGGFTCNIYQDRPNACRAYPLIDAEGARLDERCRFCKEHGTSTASAKTLQAESEALEKISGQVRAPAETYRVWRYATATGDKSLKDMMLPQGWVIDC